MPSLYCYHVGWRYSGYTVFFRILDRRDHGVCLPWFSPLTSQVVIFIPLWLLCRVPCTVPCFGFGARVWLTMGCAAGMCRWSVLLLDCFFPALRSYYLFFINKRPLSHFPLLFILPTLPYHFSQNLLPPTRTTLT